MTENLVRRSKFQTATVIPTEVVVPEFRRRYNATGIDSTPIPRILPLRPYLLLTFLTKHRTHHPAMEHMTGILWTGPWWKNRG